MSKSLTKEQKSLHEIAQEKSFLKGRWKALKVENQKDMDVVNEKSYIEYRWKHLNQEEKALKSVLNSKAVKNAPAPATETFAQKFMKSRKSIKAAHALLKSLSELPTADFKNAHRLEAYFHGRKMYEVIGKMFGEKEDDKEADEEKEAEEGLKNLSRLLLTTKNLEDAPNDVNVHHPSGKLKGGKKDDFQQFGDGGSLVKKGSKDFDVMKEARNTVNTESKPNPAKIAKLGEDHDVAPFTAGNPGSREHDHILSEAGKTKDFPEMESMDGEMNVTKPGGNSCVHLGSEEMQQWGDGGSLVKFFKRVADAGMFLKALAYEKAFGDAHRAMAKSLAASLAKNMNKPFAEEHSEFPGDLGNVLQEGEEHRDSKKALPPGDPMMNGLGDEDPMQQGMNPMMDEMGGGLGGEGNPLEAGGLGEGDPMAGDGLGQENPFAGGGLGLEEDEEQLDDDPLMGKSGLKSLSIVRNNILKQSQDINALQKTIFDLQKVLNN